MLVCDCRESPFHGAPAAANRCTQAGNCRVDADCGASGYCSPSYSIACGINMPIVGFFCHTVNDECIDDSECQVSPTTGQGFCAFDPLAKRWVCSDRVCRD
jgi:hypothetical protein